MNEQLQQAVADLINKSVATAEKAGDFIISELPDVVEQLLLYEFWYSLIMFLFGLAFVFASAYGITSGSKTIISVEEGDKPSHFVPFAVFKLVISVIMALLGIASVLLEHTWFKIWIAPKVWLIEYAANLVK